jgi:hypothetical protein
VSDYITLAQLKASAGLDQSYADADLSAAISAASRGIDQACSRFFFQTPLQDRLYTPINAELIMIDDLFEFDSLTTDQDFDGDFEETWAAKEFSLTPLNADKDGKPFTRIELNNTLVVAKIFPAWENASVKVSGKFGWPTVPPGVIDATTILATKLAKRKREAPFGIVQSFMDVGAAARIAKTDPDVSFLISSYVREYAN